MIQMLQESCLFPGSHAGGPAKPSGLFYHSFRPTKYLHQDHTL